MALPTPTADSPLKGDSCPPTCSACGQEWYEGVESECIKRSRCGFRPPSTATLRDALIVMAADMLMTGEMPPEDASDWGFSKSTTLRDKVRVIGYARRSREQCRKWGVRLSEIAKSLPNANVDLPDTAAQDSASKSNSPAVSG